jgi:hypothetical protein
MNMDDIILAENIKSKNISYGFKKIKKNLDIK